MKKHPELTQGARFKDKRSYIGWRIHPGTSHHCQYVKGADVGPVRMQVFEREGGRCWSCGAYAGSSYGHLRHIVGGLGIDRCWCLENLGWGCPTCHLSKEHKQPQMRGKLDAATL